MPRAMLFRRKIEPGDDPITGGFDSALADMSRQDSVAASRKCDCCGKSFSVTPSHAGRHRFCSSRCQRAEHRAAAKREAATVRSFGLRDPKVTSPLDYFEDE